MVPPEPYINRTRSSFPYGKNDQLFDNQPRRTRRPCPCRQLLPSVAGSGGGMPHRMRSRLDQGAKPFPLSASISAIHHWMPVWSRKTVSAQCSPHLRISGSCPGFFGVVMLSGSTAHTCAPCGLPAVSEPPALVSLVRACGGASFAPTPRLLRASLPLRRYVRRVGGGTWPRGAVFPAFPVVHEDILQK